MVGTVEAAEGEKDRGYDGLVERRKQWEWECVIGSMLDADKRNGQRMMA